MDSAGRGWGGGGNVAGTLALDVVTLPIQAPFLPLLIPPSEAAARQRAQSDAALMTVLEANPQIAITEKWDRLDVYGSGRGQMQTDTHRRVLVASFSNPKVHYTQDQIENIYEKMLPAVSAGVFRSQSCSQEFLAKHFDAEFKRAANYGPWNRLAAIVSNPNAPLDLVEKIATAQGFAGGATMAAQQALHERHGEGKDQSKQDTQSAYQ